VRVYSPKLILLIIAVVALSACRESETGDKLVAISPHPETLLYEFGWAFRPWYRRQTGRDIKIVWLDQGGTSKMLRFLYNEFQRSPKGVEIDLVWGGGIDPYQELAARNLLHPYKVPERILAAIPRDYSGIPLYDSRYRWYATTLAGFGIVYNRRVLALQGLPTPKTWVDLTRPGLFSWVGSADPRQSGSSHMAYEIILQAYGWSEGWRIITLMGANVKAFSRLASDVPRDVSLGEIACGPCIDAYAYAQMAFAGRDVLGYVMPEGLTVVNPDGIAILKGAPDLDAAEMFLRFVLSEQGQRMFMAPVGAPDGPRQFRLARMAVLPVLYERLGRRSVVPVNPFRLRSALRYDPVKGSARWKVLNDLIGALVVENHELLKRAWREVNRCRPQVRERLLARLCEVPVGEEEALALARTKWKDPVARSRVVVEWSRFARAKYAAVLREARQAVGQR